MEKVKEKKIGVKFKQVLSKRYCYLTYGGMNTRFPFSKEESKSFCSDKNEEEWIRQSLRIVIKNVKKFQLKGIKSSLTHIWKPLESFEEVYYSILGLLGDALSYNEYQKVFIDKEVEHFDSTLEFVTFLSESYVIARLNGNERTTIKSLLDLINENEFEKSVIRLSLMEFQQKTHVQTKNWIENFDKNLNNFIDYSFSEKFRIEHLPQKKLDKNIAKNIIANNIEASLYVLGIFQSQA